jgi:S-formylglutathione hydrolase FrmB
MRIQPIANPGQIHRLRIESSALQGNAPGDPATRFVRVYTPPDYDEAEQYPLFMDLVGYTGSGLSPLNWKPFGMNLPQRLDHLIAGGKMGPVVVALPDCFTAYGGNQYINSSATGRYMDHLIDEVIPVVEHQFSVHSGQDSRAVFGKSSGGYGALMHGLLRPDVWGAIACHSGDAYFEFAYLTDLPDLLTELAKHGESLERFLEAIWAKEKLERSEGMALMMIGMAAHYDPDPQAPLGFRLPVDPHTGQILAERWERWLAHDPVRLVDGHADDLRKLKGIYIDCGTKDQFRLLWGARIIHQKLDDLGIAHEYQEFNDNHSDIDYRMNESLPFLYRALTSPDDSANKSPLGS